MRLARRAAAGLLAGVALAAALRLGPPAAASPLEAAAPPGLRWEAVADGLRLDWQAPPAGAADAYAPLSALVALPPGAAPRLEVERLVESASAGPAEAPAAEAALQIEAAGVMRGVSLARLTFYPARRQAGRLRLTTRVEARLLFNAPAGARSSEGLEAGLDAVRAIVLNPAQVWPAPAAPSAARAAPAAAVPRAVIEVTQ
ncbi:MAG: hypothetical protein JNK29_04305, partial [Anaerolineales bacterium]|nr:hypothetical protein [Anaerolineales bacterium]